MNRVNQMLQATRMPHISVRVVYIKSTHLGLVIDHFTRARIVSEGY